MTIRFSDDQTAAIPTLEDIIARNMHRSAEQEKLPALQTEYGAVGIAALCAATLCMKLGSKSGKKHSDRERVAA